MTYGLSVINQNSVTIIDGSLSNYRVIQKGTFNPQIGVVSFPTQSEPPFVFVRPAVYGKVMGTPPNTRSVVTLNNFYFIDYTGSNNSAEYFILAPITARSSNNYGLEVRNPSGSTILDSGYELAGVDGIVNLNSSLLNLIADVDFTITLPSPPAGKRRFICINPIGTFFMSETDGNGTNLWNQWAAIINSETSITYRKRADGSNGDNYTAFWYRDNLIGMAGYIA